MAKARKKQQRQRVPAGWPKSTEELHPTPVADMQATAVALKHKQTERAIEGIANRMEVNGIMERWQQVRPDVTLELDEDLALGAFIARVGWKDSVMVEGKGPSPLWALRKANRELARVMEGIS